MSPDGEMRPMDLRTFLTSIDGVAQIRFAKSCKTSIGYLRNVATGYRPCSAKLAVLIERYSLGAVTRKELRPDWIDVWPELSQHKKSRATPKRVEAPRSGGAGTGG